MCIRGGRRGGGEAKGWSEGLGGESAMTKEVGEKISLNVNAIVDRMSSIYENCFLRDFWFHKEPKLKLYIPCNPERKFN